MIFVICFLVDLYITQCDKRYGDLPNFVHILQLILKIICLATLLKFFAYEVKLAIKQGKYYFKDYWNYFDILFIVTFFTNVIGGYLDLYDIIITYLDVCILLLAFIKLNFFLRIFEGFSYLASMM